MNIIKIENREHHLWGLPDEFGIETCFICKKLRRREAISTFTLRVKNNIKGKWRFFYSIKGTKWSESTIECN